MNKGYAGKLVVAIMAAVLVMVGCTACNKAPETKKVSIGVLKLTSSAPIFIGLEKGFFKEQGLEVDAQWFEAAQPIAVATASNKVDIGATGITASLFNMVAAGQNLAIVADKGREQKGYLFSAVVVRSDLWDQGVTGLEGLKGKKIGITQTGSTFHYMIGRLLEAKGMSLADVELVSLGKLGAMMAALQGKQVDAIIVGEPNLTQVVQGGYGKMIAQVADVMDYQTSAIFFSPNFVKDRETAIRFMKGYIMSTRYYYDAVLTQQNGKVVPGANYEEVVKIIAKYTGAPVEEIKSSMPYMDRNGKLLESDIQTQIDWYASHKMTDKPVSASLVVNTGVWEEALKQMK